MISDAYCIVQKYELKPGVLKKRSYDANEPRTALSRFDSCVSDTRTVKITIFFRYRSCRCNKLTPILTYDRPLGGVCKPRDFGIEIFERFLPAGNERPDTKQMVLI
jgi:hypothetical protein